VLSQVLPGLKKIRRSGRRHKNKGASPTGLTTATRLIQHNKKVFTSLWTVC